MRMLLSLAAAAVALAILPARAAMLDDRGDGLGCYDLADQKRIDSAAGSGDREGTTALIQKLLDTRRCGRMYPGLKVRIEQTSYPYACVVKMGTANDCLWVQMKGVDVSR